MYRRPEIVQTQDAITTTKQLIVEDRDEVQKFTSTSLRQCSAYRTTRMSAPRG
jgi:hypothetical protein